MATKADAAPLTAEERAAAREARRADNREKHRARRNGAEAPEFAASQTQSLDAVLQTLGGSDQGISITVLQIAPQGRGELGGPSHILEQPYSPSLRESDLKDLARQSGCAEPGTFELRVVKSTEKGPKIIHVFRRQWRWKPDPASAPAVDPLADVDRFARTAVALKSLSGMGAIDAALVNALKPQPYAPPPANPVTDDLIRAMIARALAPPPDPIATLSGAVAFIDQARGPVAPPADPMKLLSGLGEMLSTVKALAGGLGGTPAPASSPWIEVLQLAAGALGPLVANLPAMWQMAQQTKAQELEARKRETLARYVAGGIPLAAASILAGVPLPPGVFGPLTPGREEAPAEAPSSAADGPSGGPLAPFHHAIVEGDRSVFPALAGTILALPGGVGQKILDTLATEPNALALIRAQIDAGGGHAYFAEIYLPGSEPFFAAFAEWLQAQGGAPA